MADDNSNGHENEVLPENSVPVEVEVPDNEVEEEHGDDAVDTQDNEEEEQAGAAVEEGGAPATEGVVDKKWHGWPGESVFRMLVPVQKAGGIIGRKDEYIKKTCEETRARIKILDGPPGTTERTSLNAYEFERHAGCKTKHPNNHIYFESRKTIYQIVQELRNTSENLLFDAIQTVTGSPINQKAFRSWKASFQAATRELQRIYGKDELNI